MIKESVSDEEMLEMDDYLKSYAMYAHIIRIDSNKKRTATIDLCDDLCIDIPIARAKTFEIRHFVMDLPNCNEKLLLYYHFIKCETINRCAELLGISRSSAFRLKKRALRLAIKHMKKINMPKNNENIGARSA